MRSIILITTVYLLLSLQDTFAQQIDLSKNPYCSYVHQNLLNTIDAHPLGSKYKSLILNAEGDIGLPDLTNIELAETDRYGVFAVINTKSFREALLFSPQFFDSVLNVTDTKSISDLFSIFYTFLATI